MGNPHELKVRHWSDIMTELVEYLFVFPGRTSEGETSKTELNENILMNMQYGCRNQEYVQGSDYVQITLKRYQYVLVYGNPRKHL